MAILVRAANPDTRKARSRMGIAAIAGTVKLGPELAAGTDNHARAVTAAMAAKAVAVMAAGGADMEEDGVALADMGAASAPRATTSRRTAVTTAKTLLSIRGGNR